MSLKKFLEFIETTDALPLEIERIRSLASRWAEQKKSRLNYANFDKLLILLGRDRPGYVAVRDVVAKVVEFDSNSRFDRNRHASTIMIMLGFKKRNSYVDGVKTRCWLRGWSGRNLSGAIASGEVRNLLPPIPPMPVVPCPVPLPNIPG